MRGLPLTNRDRGRGFGICRHVELSLDRATRVSTIAGRRPRGRSRLAYERVVHPSARIGREDKPDRAVRGPCSCSPVFRQRSTLVRRRLALLGAAPFGSFPARPGQGTRFLLVKRSRVKHVGELFWLRPEPRRYARKTGRIFSYGASGGAGSGGAGSGAGSAAGSSPSLSRPVLESGSGPPGGG